MPTETSVRAGMMSCGAKGHAVLSDEFDAELLPLSCPSCESASKSDTLSMNRESEALHA